MSEYDTKPTIETVLEAMQAGFAAINDRFVTIELRLTAIEQRLDSIEQRLDSIEQRSEGMDTKLDLFIEEVITMKRKLRKTAQ